MRVNIYRANEDTNAFEFQCATIQGVTRASFAAARALAHSSDESDEMCADLHDDAGDIVDVITFSRQMYGRVVAAITKTER